MVEFKHFLPEVYLSQSQCYQCQRADKGHLFFFYFKSRMINYRIEMFGLTLGHNVLFGTVHNFQSCFGLFSFDTVPNLENFTFLLSCT